MLTSALQEGAELRALEPWQAREFAEYVARNRAHLGGTLFRVFDAAAGVCEIGVWLAPEAQGRGLINQAARLMIDWAIEVRDIPRVKWYTVPDNGVRHDVEIWSLLKRA